MRILESMQFVIEGYEQRNPQKIAAQKDADRRAKLAGYTNADVGSGIGKLVGSNIGSVGGVIGSVGGTVAGHYIGKNAVDNPKGRADLTKKSHRLGIIADKTSSMRQAKVGAKGGAVGAGIGALASTMSDRIPVGVGTAVGALGGAAAGAAGSAMKAGYRHAKKMGYGKVGRIGNAIFPLSALTTPKSQSDARTK